MQSVRLILPALLAGVVLTAAACGGDSKPRASNDSGDPSALATGTPATDEEYLKVFCSGATEYQEAVNTSKTADGITKAIKDYVAALQGIVPPDDLRDFHASYIKFLQDAEPDPTSLLTTSPPLPPQGARDRLATKTADVDECKYPTFLGSSDD